MSAHVYGLDVHKRYTYATILGPDGEILAQKKMDNEEVRGFLEPYPVEHVAMEATTGIAPLYCRLASEGHQVHVAHPDETKSSAKARIKTDRTISRASIISFLNEMSRHGVLEFEEATGKGGRRRIYREKLDEGSFRKAVVRAVMESLLRDFP